jgi:endonuclease YncB( thermonuclease family)
MNRAVAKLICFALSLVLSVSAPAQMVLRGLPVVIDGDSVELNKVRLRLYGIHAPTLGQQCSAAGADWLCGEQAAVALREKVAAGSGEISCRILDPGAKPPKQAVCQQGELVLNRWLVERGWALPGTDTSGLLDGAMEVAMDEQLGIWRYGFVPNDSWKRVAGVAMEDEYTGCSSCELRHKGLADRQKAKQLDETPSSD